MNKLKTTFVASASELQSSDLYMTIKATLFTIPDANLNGVRCTAEFLDEIVENQDKYIGLPLCADIKNLELGRYQKLGHCYNSRTGTFGTAIIGSFYKFEKEEREDGSAALIGYARVMKRNKAVCHAISELFEDNALKFSFEISCGTFEKLDDGTTLIVKADNNFLEGMCIVSLPACPDAVAMQLVAEMMANDNDFEKEATAMQNIVSEEVVDVKIVKTTEEEVAECKCENDEEAECKKEKSADEEAECKKNKSADEEAECKSEEDAECKKKCANEEAECKPEEDAECKKKCAEEENAELHHTQRICVEQTDEYHDYEKGIHVEDRTIEIHEECVPVTTEVPGFNAEEVKTAEETELNGQTNIPTDYAAQIAQLIASIDELKKEIAELKKTEVVEEVIAEAKPQINPFISEMSSPKKYTLLDPYCAPSNYSLLDKE